jgi:hypothetical protein
MAGRIGKITADPEVKRAKNGDTDVLMLTVRFSDGGAASVQWMPGVGEDTAPQRGDTVAVERYGGVLVAASAKSPGDPARKPGERELYSRDPFGKKAALLLMEDNGAVSLESPGAAGKAAAALSLQKSGEAELSSRSPAGKQADVSLGAQGAMIASMAAGKAAAAHGMKPTGTQYIGNALAGQDIFTVMTAFITAFSTYTGAVTAALEAATKGSPPPTQDPGALAAFTAINSAAQTLATAQQAFAAQWALIFDPVPPVPPPEAP